MAGVAVITEACIDVKDRACVDVCPVQCIYEFDPAKNVLWSEQRAGSGEIENTHRPDPKAIDVFGDGILYVNLDECTSCTACYAPDVCPVGAIYPDDQLPDGTSTAKYNAADPNKGHDHSFLPLGAVRPSKMPRDGARRRGKPARAGRAGGCSE